MITPKSETKKRLEIIKYIRKGLDEIVDCIVLGGSMGYGQNYSVAPWCDIDTVMVIDKQKVDRLMHHAYFNQTVSDYVVDMFRQGKIDFFWSSRVVSGIQVDVFVYNKDSFVDFCLLKKGITGYIHTKPSETQKAFNFAGNEVTVKRTVQPYKDGFLFSKPALIDGKYWGGVPRDDFLFMSHVVYEKDGFYSKLGKKVWIVLAKQLKKEHGQDADLKRFNILNSSYTYQTNRQGLSPATIRKIESETKKYLK